MKFLASFFQTLCVALVIGILAIFLGSAWRNGKLAEFLRPPGNEAGVARSEQVQQVEESSGSRARIASRQKAQSFRVPGAERMSMQRVAPSSDANESSQDDALQAPPRRVAPEGTFYLLEYVSATTDRGVVGFEPGQRVTLIEPIPDKGMLRVTDGKYKAEIHPSQMTNDLDLANLARMRDAAGQRQIQAYQDAQRRQYEAVNSKINEEYSKRVSEHNAKAVAASAIGTSHSPLNEEAKPTSSYYGGYIWVGSPYYYLNSNYYRSSSGYPYYYNPNGYNYYNRY